MEKLFRLQENGTTVRTEVLAGLTTFMTMAYIIALNPNLLTNFDTSGSGPLERRVPGHLHRLRHWPCSAWRFWPTSPLHMAPGMGLNSFFAVVVANIVALTGMSYVESFQSALVIILAGGHRLPGPFRPEHPGEDRQRHPSGRAPTASPPPSASC